MSKLYLYQPFDVNVDRNGVATLKPSGCAEIQTDEHWEIEPGWNFDELYYDCSGDGSEYDIDDESGAAYYIPLAMSEREFYAFADSESPHDQAGRELSYEEIAYGILNGELKVA